MSLRTYWLDGSHLLLCRKNRLHKQARKTNRWNNYRQFQRECKRAFRRAEWSYVNNVIQDGLAQNNTKPFWRYVKSKQQDNIGVSPLKRDGVLHSDNKSKAEILLNQFSSVFTRAISQVMPVVSRRVTNSLQELVISPQGVEKLLRNIQASKASGPDSLPNLVLKECAHELAPAVAHIFQKSLDSSILPDDWTNANIAPVFKKGDRHAPENYRPVSLTSVLSKVLEHIICRNMLRHFEANRVLTSLNHGFRAGYSCETQLAVTIDDFTRNYDLGSQTDIAILDFSKAFDTVPHDRLLHKLDAYGIRGPLLSWIKAFLCNRHMRVVVDGESSSEAPVVSGVPQGTVLGPLLFLCHINDLPERVSSSVRLFADDCLLYRRIRNHDDHLALQNDLHNLESWANDWGMRINATKCYVLSIRKKSSFFYQLNNTILKEVPNNPYLGLTISADLKWNTHINSICKKASATLGFIRRNLQHSPKAARRTAYISLVRSTLEYGSIIWDPFLQSDINKLERIQRKAARFICKDYKSRDSGCVTNMLRDLDLPTLQERRKELRLAFLYKVVEGLVPAIPSASYLTPIRSKRRIRAKVFGDYVSTNIVTSSQTNNSKCFVVPTASTEVYKHSFFVRTIIDWNQLDDNIVGATSVESFKSRLHSD